MNLWAATWQNVPSHVHPMKTKISLCFHTVCSGFIVCIKKVFSQAIQNATSEFWSDWANAWGCGVCINLQEMQFWYFHALGLKSSFHMKLSADLLQCFPIVQDRVLFFFIISIPCGQHSSCVGCISEFLIAAKYELLCFANCIHLLIRFCPCWLIYSCLNVQFCCDKMNHDYLIIFCLLYYRAI